MTLMLASFAFATELHLEVSAPDGSHAALTADVRGPVVLTHYPLAVGGGYTALISAENAEMVCTVTVEIYKGDLRKRKLVKEEKLVLTNYETSYATLDAGEGRKKARLWSIQAKIEESIDRMPTPDGTDRSPTTSAPGADERLPVEVAPTAP